MLTVSYMANPAVTLPPGELMYRWMGLEVSSASRKRSCATVNAASVSLICYECSMKAGNEKT